jgi:hypothetical protein
MRQTREQLHTFLASALKSDEWSPLCRSHFVPRVVKKKEITTKRD